MPPPPPAPPRRAGKVQVYRAVYAYTAANRDELTFQEGDLIYVSEERDDGWCKATINGKTGLIPGNYIEKSNAETIDHPLHEAAKRGNLPFLKECVTNGVSVNALDKAGATPLHWAARGGHIECMQELLKTKKAKVNVQNKLGDTPLHGAAWRGNADAVELLLENGADTNITNNEGLKPYDLAKVPEVGRLLVPRSSALDDDYADSDED